MTEEKGQPCSKYECVVSRANSSSHLTIEKDLNMLAGTYEEKEEGYKVIVNIKNGRLRTGTAKGNGLLNKMIISVIAFSAAGLLNTSPGRILDFTKVENEKYSVINLGVNGAKLLLTRVE